MIHPTPSPSPYRGGECLRASFLHFQVRAFYSYSVISRVVTPKSWPLSLILGKSCFAF